MSSPMTPLLKLVLFLQNFLLTIPKNVMLLFLHSLGIPLENSTPPVSGQESQYSSATTYDQFMLSPLLVPLPIEFTIESLKAEQTLLLKYGGGQRREEEEEVCAVCLACLKEKGRVRRIRSCCHVFHEECLDAWFHAGHATCPLCRCDLSLRQSHCGGDPWRRERMIYLFGDDNITF